MRCSTASWDFSHEDLSALLEERLGCGGEGVISTIKGDENGGAVRLLHGKSGANFPSERVYEREAHGGGVTQLHAWRQTHAIVGDSESDKTRWVLRQVYSDLASLTLWISVFE